MKLLAITALFNWYGWRSRLDNYRRFAVALKEQGVPLLTVEAACGVEQIEAIHGEVLRIKAHPGQCFWQRERLVMLALQHAPADFDAVAWLDADLIFERPDWVPHTIRALMKVPIVQPYEWVVFEGEGRRRASAAFRPKGGHTGMAWCARRDFLVRNGLFDKCIVGGADAVLWAGVSGMRRDTLDRHAPKLRAQWEPWVEQIARDVRGRVGFAPGEIRHIYHGSRDNRRYRTRHDSLAALDYDPERDIELGDNGLHQWSGKASPVLRATVERYFRQRREDDDIKSPEE